MLNALSDMCALDLRPFYTVSGAGFRGVIQQALDIGFESKTPLFADDVLCDRTTIKRNCQSCKDSALESLLEDCKDHVADGLMMGATTDLWTDDDSKKSYISVTLHRIDEYFRLHDRTLAVREFDGESHTAPNILTNFNDIIEPFIMLDDEIRTDLIVVNTDNASNNGGAGGLESKYTRILCADHKVDTCISYVLKKRTHEINGVRLPAFYEFEEEAPLVFNQITNCKKAVTAAKQGSFHKNISPKLQQEIVTRWYGLYIMLNSFKGKDRLSELMDTFKVWKRPQFIVCLDGELNSELVRFLYVFKQGTLALEAFKKPTPHLVAFWRQKLLSHCEPIRETVMQEDDNDVEVELLPDCDDIIAIKRRVRKQILQKFILEPLHIVAALLDPRQKHRLHRMGINETQVTQGKSDLAALMLKVGPGRTHVLASRRPISSRQGSKSKKHKTMIRSEVGPSICSNDESDVNSKDDAAQEQSATRVAIDKELLDYMTLKLMPDEKKQIENDTPSSGLLSWWRGRVTAFPPSSCRALCAGVPSNVCQERVQLQRRWQYPDSQAQQVKPEHSRHVVHAVEHREVNTSSY